MQICNSAPTTRLSFTSHKNIPRYLYHLTTRENANRILQSGAHIRTPKNDYQAGFYMFDLNNFLRHWTNPFYNFSSKLFCLTAHVHDSMELALLKIPVKNLNTENLRIRSQLSLHSLRGSYDRNHNQFGDVVSKVKHYTRKKHPIEYIYLDNIPAESIEKVGECHANDNIMMRMYLGLGNAKELMQQLVKGQPEEKGINICKFGKFDK